MTDVDVAREDVVVADGERIRALGKKPSRAHRANGAEPHGAPGACDPTGERSPRPRPATATARHDECERLDLSTEIAELLVEIPRHAGHAGSAADERHDLHDAHHVPAPSARRRSTRTGPSR